MRFALIVTLAVAGAACDHNELVGCVNNTQCPEGNICDAGRCEKVCSGDIDCARGYICIDSICEPGIRSDAPSISGVVGNGSQSCTDSPDDRCFADAIVIQGANLLGSSFRLDNQGTGPSFTNLAIGSQNTDDQVEIELPTDLAPGSYFLVAANAAGSDQADVQILQGEPGPALTGQEMLTAINTGATGMFLVARMPDSDALIAHINQGGTTKFVASLIPDGGGTAYTANDIVGLVNSATNQVYSERLGRDANDVITRINAGSTAFNTSLLGTPNAIITYLNSADGSVELGTHIAPGDGGGGGTMTGAQIVTAINDSGSRIDADNITTGTASGTIALGNHTHTGVYANNTHTHAGTDITSEIPYTRLPIDNTSTSVARGNHTHPGTGAPLTYGPVAHNASVAVTQADLNSKCEDSDGCTIRIGITGWGFNDGGWVYPSGILWGPDCNVHTDGADWVVGYACAHIYTIPSGTYQPYITDIFGDGTGSSPWVLGYNAGGASADWVCNLRENNSNNDYEFSATSSGTTLFPTSGRCYLVIED